MVEEQASSFDGLATARRRVRRRAPLVALLPPALLLGLGALLWDALPCSGQACTTNGTGGWIAVLLALPTTLLFGVPFEEGGWRYLAVGATSAALWAGLGALAARRVTRRPVAGWAEFWKEYVWYLLGVWAGVLAALAVVAVGLGSRAIF